MFAVLAALFYLVVQQAGKSFRKTTRLRPTGRSV